MGLTQLQQFTKSLTPQQLTFLGIPSQDALLCLEALLILFAGNLAILATLVSFLQAFKAYLDLLIAELQLLITQLDVLIQIYNALIQPFVALENEIEGELAVFAPFFAAAQNCPPVANLENAITSLFSGGSTLQFIANVKQWVKKVKFQIAQWNKFVQRLNAKIESIKTYESFIDTIINAIKAQNPGV